MSKPVDTAQFRPTKAMWLTLPGAAMCSLPIGLFILPRLASAGFPVFSSLRGSAGIVMLLLIPIGGIGSRAAYRYCISTTGHPGLRMALILFNFVAWGLADIACVLILILFCGLLVGLVWK